MSCKGTYFWGKYQKIRGKKDPLPPKGEFLYCISNKMIAAHRKSVGKPMSGNTI
jgi:hypothetical protein